MVLKSKKYIFLFLSPAVLLITIFLYYPLAKTVQFSLSNYSEWALPFDYIGLENYTRLFTDQIIHRSLLNTLILLIGCVIFEIGLALVLAVLIDSINRGFKFFRMVYFFPVVISGSAIGLMFYLVFQYDYGLLNNILAVFGMDKVVWITEKSAMYLVLIPVLWQYVGFYFVIFLTAIAAVPADIYESALLDGITGFKKTIYITIPLIKNVLVTSLGLVIAGSLKVFDIVYVMTNGGPLDASQLLSTYLYQQAFVFNNQGYGSAIAVLIIALGLVIYLLTTKLAQRKDELY